MKTIKEIETYLKTVTTTTDPIFDKLANDHRKGVQLALKRWYKLEEKRQIEQQKHLEKQHFDNSYRPFEKSFVAGVDEAGRGPLAGPVVTAAVILPEHNDVLIGVDDSKAMTQEKRQQFANRIREHALAYAVHIQPAERIDKLNIYEATRQSMECAIQKLKITPDFVITDAMPLSIAQPHVALTKADVKSLAVGAASILAKTVRDKYMETLHEQYPSYGFDQHAGYGTKRHLEAIRLHGPCLEHRKTFEPLKSMIKSDDHNWEK